ncbi:hypothetical protein ACUNV4_15940 [Granulosicoccus sp. 3-233]|uniref:hypothetical protein n=1 Tax=Granulosicoccus sp. 3-233 TaxID=3417969 RepID=UPI003D356575
MLVTCATFNYLDMLCLLLASHRASNPDIPLAVHAIGWPDEYLQAARQLYPNASFHAHTDLHDGEPMEMKGPVPRSAAILKLKVRLLHESYHSSNDPVTWVDADTLLLKPMKPLLARVAETGDFAVTYRSRKRAHARFAVAVLCFMRTDRAASLLDRYAQLTQQTSGTTKRKPGNEVAWFHDQLALWQAWQESSRGVLGLPRRNAPRMVPLTDAEHSIDGSTDAIFVSRRDKVLDTQAMLDVLQERGVVLSSVHDAVAT